MRKFWNFKADANEPEDGVLEVRGVLVADDDWFSDGAISAKNFRAELAKYRNVTVIINSPGGDVMAGAEMYSALREGKIRKEYLAVLSGIPEKKAGEIRTYLRRKPLSVIEREECPPDAEGAKEALTEYRVLAESEGRALVLASPVTGRTHQLRVQFAGIGCPIEGDTLYGTASPLIARHALHSIRTSYPHPASGERMTSTAPLPPDMRSLLSALGLEEPEI